MNGARRTTSSTPTDPPMIRGETRAVVGSVEDFTITEGEWHSIVTSTSKLAKQRFERVYQFRVSPKTTEYSVSERRAEEEPLDVPVEFVQEQGLFELGLRVPRYFIRLDNSTALDDPLSGVIFSPWLRTAISELDELANLPPNWDEYGVAAPNSQAIENTRRIIEGLHEKNLRPSGIAPCPEEGVTLSFLRRERSAAIECYNTGEIVAVTSARDADPTVWSLNNDRRQLRTTVETIQVFLDGSGK